MFDKITTAVRKFFFCFSITADLTSFFRLLVNTKRYRYGSSIRKDTPVPYRLLLNGRKEIVFLRTYSGDIEIFYEVFWKKAYSLPPHAAKRLSTIVDLGANTGMASLFFLTHYPNTRVYAVEADSQNMQVLLMNLSSAIASNRVVALHAAVFSEDTELYLQVKEKAYNSSISQQKTDIPVQGISMNTLMQKYALDKIDLLKVDIEGGEEVLFAENTNWIDKVGIIIAEIHRPEFRIVCETILRNRGFQTGSLFNPAITSSLLWATKRS